MSPGNLRDRVADEVAEAARLLRIAEALIGLGGFKDAANRAYYAVYHLSMAMLVLLGHEPRTHAGVKALLGSELVRPGRIDSRAAKTFAELEDLRLASDYESFSVVTREQAEHAVTSARDFEALTRACLDAQGF